MAKKRGRPKASAGERHSTHLDIRLSEQEKEAFWGAAKLSGETLSNWIRQRLRAASKGELEAAGKPVAFLLD